MASQVEVLVAMCTYWVKSGVSCIQIWGALCAVPCRNISLQYAGQSVEEVHPALMRLEAEGGMLLIEVS
jgi:hypothetical protein